MSDRFASDRFVPTSIEFAELPSGYEILGADVEEVSDPSQVKLRDPDGNIITWADLMPGGDA
ncbi:hypothetical protein UFOVP1040_4 [uncultured Caudovirales phage]|uniref:Uncharacterized protein n=1 Tax=uncultured Caudovirales phage TaxID=2100421 RepID=A0A6J5QFS4_9CAUD|nr:hypothetical protein UFOVP1040_4 [uncultured Caudovirales phage]